MNIMFLKNHGAKVRFFLGYSVTRLEGYMVKGLRYLKYESCMMKLTKRGTLSDSP